MRLKPAAPRRCSIQICSRSNGLGCSAWSRSLAHSSGRTSTVTSMTSTSTVFAGEFAPAPSFQGARAGFVFRRGSAGLGYYRDDAPPSATAALLVPQEVRSVCRRHELRGAADDPALPRLRGSCGGKSHQWRAKVDVFASRPQENRRILRHGQNVHSHARCHDQADREGRSSWHPLQNGALEPHFAVTSSF
eukprot:SAG11_NODE_90_length_17153_cov_63.471033_12_plen_191_part_00